jgi:hypothetical protein
MMHSSFPDSDENMAIAISDVSHGLPKRRCLFLRLSSVFHASVSSAGSQSNK